MEIWDAYDEQFNRIEGMELHRGTPVPDGVFHLVCDVAVRHRDGTWLLMQRDLRKSFGGMWELTAGGSALAGETPLVCAIRELAEETGITASVLREAGRVVSKETHRIYAEYLCVTDIDKNQVTLQEGETSDYRWVTKEQLHELIDSGVLTERSQAIMTSLYRADMTAPCGNGLLNIRTGAIIEKNGKYLMAYNPEISYLYTVGGRIKFGETAEEAVIREVMEETGIRMEIDRLAFVHQNYFYGFEELDKNRLIYELAFYFYMKVPEDFEPVSGQFEEGERNQYLRWIRPDDDVHYYPEFFRTELQNPSEEVKYFLTDGRRENEK